MASGEPRAIIPPQGKGSRQLRACHLCYLIQTPQDFKRHGCPNCEEVLKMAGAADRVNICTTAQFDGMVAIVKPDESWVAKWQRADTLVRGMYAVRITVRMPETLEDDLSAQGIKPPERDGI